MIYVVNAVIIEFNIISVNPKKIKSTLFNLENPIYIGIRETI